MTTFRRPARGCRRQACSFPLEALNNGVRFLEKKGVRIEKKEPPAQLQNYGYMKGTLQNYGYISGKKRRWECKFDANVAIVL